MNKSKVMRLGPSIQANRNLVESAINGLKLIFERKKNFKEYKITNIKRLTVINRNVGGIRDDDLIQKWVTKAASLNSSRLQSYAAVDQIAWMMRNGIKPRDRFVQALVDVAKGGWTGQKYSNDVIFKFIDAIPVEEVEETAFDIEKKNWRKRVSALIWDVWFLEWSKNSNRDVLQEWFKCFHNAIEKNNKLLNKIGQKDFLKLTGGETGLWRNWFEMNESSVEKMIENWDFVSHGEMKSHAIFMLVMEDSNINKLMISMRLLYQISVLAVGSGIIDVKAKKKLYIREVLDHVLKNETSDVCIKVFDKIKTSGEEVENDLVSRLESVLMKSSVSTNKNSECIRSL